MGQSIASVSMSLDGCTAKDDAPMNDPTVYIQGDRLIHILFPAAERASAR